MAIYSKDEFLEACGLQSKHWSTYVERKQIVPDKKGNVDVALDLNKTFLEKRQAKTKNAGSKTSTGANIKTVENKNNASDGVPELSTSQKKLKHLDTIKRTKEIAKLEIEIAKRRGEVVPAELMKPIVLQHNQHMIMEFKNAVDEFIRIFSKRKALTVEEIAEIKGESVTAINGAVKRATDATVKSLTAVIINHQDKKAVGEHG